jgi:hypothetical protein
MNPSKLLGMLKNKFGEIVLNRAMKYLSKEERIEKRQFIINKINVTSSKEKSRINEFLNLLVSDVNLV